MAEKSWRDNHVIVSLVMITIVAGGITAIGTISGAYDSGHTSEAELKVVTDQMAANDLRNICSTLSIQISLAEQAIWQMDQADDDGQRLVEKKRQLRNMLSTFNELKCAKILSQR